MKFFQVLHVNGPEIEILDQALRKYRAEVDAEYAKACEHPQHVPLRPLLSKRAKITSMSIAMTRILNLPKPKVTEGSEQMAEFMDQQAKPFVDDYTCHLCDSPVCYDPKCTGKKETPDG